MARIVKVDTSATSPRPYEVRWSWYDATGKRKFKKARYRTEREAKAKKREVEDSVAAANLPDYAGGRQAVAHWGVQWLEQKRTLRKPSTFRGYKAIWDGSVEPQWGASRINTVTTADIQQWITKLLQDGKQPPTIRHHVWVLGQVFAYAARSRAITYNPVRDVELPTDRSTGRLPYSPQFLTAEEVESIAAALAEPWGSLVRFMAWTGLRTGEVSGLNIADVDLMRKTVTVRRTRSVRGGIWTEHTPKSGKPRTVPLVPWVADDLRDLLAAHPYATEPTAPLWPGTRAGGGAHNAAGRFAAEGHSGSVDYTRPWEAGTFLRRRFRPTTQALGIGSPRLHDLRHTFASLCASRGVPSQQVADWLGHANDLITRQIYTHLFDTDSALHADRLASRGRPVAQAPASVTRLREAR